MSEIVTPLYLLLALIVAAIIAWIISYFSGINFWIWFSIEIGIIFLNGVLAGKKDDLSEGYKPNSEDNKQT